MEVQDGLVVELIGAAVMAGANSLQARATPEAERGLMKMHAQYHTRVGALADAICARQANVPGGSQL